MATGLHIKHVRELHLFRRLFWLIIITALALSIWFGYKYFESGELPPFVSARSLSANDSVSQTAIGPNDISKHTTKPNEPKYISIPALSNMQYRSFATDLDDTNQLTLQKNINDISWYKNSSTPGIGYGAVILSGHGLGTKKDGPFVNAATLKSGDEIVIQTGSDTTIRYVVSEVTILPIQEALTTGSKLLSVPVNDTKEGLNIIAPAGTWVPKFQQFDSRVIIRAAIKN